MKSNFAALICFVGSSHAIG